MRYMRTWSNLNQVLISILLLIAPLTACRRSPLDEVQVEEPTAIPIVDTESPEDTQVVVFYVSIFQDNQIGNPEELLIAQFEADHPEITIARSRYQASPSAYINWLRQFPFTTVMAMPADYTTRQAIEEGLFLDLTGILVDQGLAGAYPDRFRTMLEWEGKDYLLPGFASWFAIYYNKEVFDQYGLTPPETWEEFLAVCERLSENGVAPIVYAGDNRQMASVWFDYLDMRLNSPEFHAALMEGQERYTDERAREVFNSWQLLVDRGYVMENAWGLQAEESMDMVINGTAGMILAAGYQTHDGLAFFRFPIMDPNTPVGEVVPTVGYIVLANSPDLAEAVEFLVYLGSAETQTHLTRQFGTKAGFLPLRMDVARGLFTPDMEQASSLVKSAAHITQPCFWDLDDSMTTLISAVFRSIVLGQDYEQDLMRLENTRQEIWGK